MYHGVTRHTLSTITGIFDNPVLFSHGRPCSPRDWSTLLMSPLLKSKSIENTRPTATVAVTLGRKSTTL